MLSVQICLASRVNNPFDASVRTSTALLKLSYQSSMNMCEDGLEPSHRHRHNRFGLQRGIEPLRPSRRSPVTQPVPTHNLVPHSGVEPEAPRL